MHGAIVAGSLFDYSKCKQATKGHHDHVACKIQIHMRQVHFHSERIMHATEGFPVRRIKVLSPAMCAYIVQLEYEWKPYVDAIIGSAGATYVSEALIQKLSSSAALVPVGMEE